MLISLIFLCILSSSQTSEINFKELVITIPKPFLPFSADSPNKIPILTSYPSEISVIKGESFHVHYTLSDVPETCTTLTSETGSKSVTSYPQTTVICPNDTVLEAIVRFNATSNGIYVVEVKATPEENVDTDEAFSRISIGLSSWIIVLSNIFGWIYTIAWDVSFLPQIIHNWRRHSVIGLSFDFLTLNIIGFTFYFFFNAGLLWFPTIQAQYYDRNPTSVLHVRINDVIFSLYAMICTVITILQCFFYERGNQVVSKTCRIIASLLVLSAVVFAIVVACVDDLWWLDLLYFFSYIKLTITCIKYPPQLYLNYKHKSTAGWSIWQVFLDFTGGSFSLLQMFLLAVNYNDWNSVLTDPAKLGLGLLSIFFNILFFIQHYCLYRNAAPLVPAQPDQDAKHDLNDFIQVNDK